MFATGDFSGLLMLLKVITFGEGYGSDFGKDAVLGNKKLGLPKQDLVSSVTALVAGKPIGTQPKSDHFLDRPGVW